MGAFDDLIAPKASGARADSSASLESQPGIKEAGRQSSEYGRGFINAAQGPLFGFADEIGGAGAALVDKLTQRNPGMSFGDLYTRYRDFARGGSEQYQKDHPVLAPAGQVVASLPFMGIAKGVESVLPPAKTALQTVRNGVGVGTVLGTVQGAGDAQSIFDIPIESAKGAAMGGLVSGVGAALGQGVSAVANNVRARMSDKSAADLARERLAAALARDDSGVEQALARLRKLGPEATIADSAGKNTRDLLDTMAAMPGRTADRAETMIRNRQIGRADRILEGATGLANGRQLPAELAALTKEQADKAGPLYNAIRDVPVAADERLQRILQRPVIQDAIAQARVAAANADSTLPDIKAGEPAMMKVWDQIKRGLDDVIGLKKRNVDVGTATNAAKSTLADAVRTKRELVAVLDDLVPDYRAARNAFSGPAALKDAMEEGRALFSMKPADLRVALSELTESERDAFRVGAAQALRERVGTESGQTSVLKFWKEPATRERLQAIFPNTRTYREFEAALLAEGRLKMLESVGRGSQTAPRQFRADDEGAAFLKSAIDAGAAFKSPSPGGLVGAARNIYGRMVMPEQVRDQIGGLLLSNGPKSTAALGDLSRYVEQEQARRASMAAKAGLLHNIRFDGLLNP